MLKLLLGILISSSGGRAWSQGFPMFIGGGIGPGSVNNAVITPSTVQVSNCLQEPANGSTFQAGCGNNNILLNGSSVTASGGITLLSGGAFTLPGLSSNTVVYLNSSSQAASMPQLGEGGLIIGTSIGVAPSTGTLTGTANRVTVTNAAGSITLSGPQDLATTSRPQFTSLVLTSTLTVQGNAFSVGASTLIVANGLVGVGTSNPVSTLTVAGTASFGSGANISTVTANGSLILASGASITLSGASGNVTNSSSMTASAFFGNGANITSLTPSNLSAGAITPTATISTANVVPGFNAASQLTQLNSAGNLSLTFGLIAATGTFKSTATVQGNAFSVGGSSFSVIGGQTGLGVASPTAGYILDIQDAAAKSRIQSTTGTNTVFHKYNNTGGDLYIGRQGSVGNELFSSGGSAYSGAIDASGTNALQIGVNDAVAINIVNGGQTTFTPNLSSSTSSGALSGTFTNTTLGTCIAGSTITLTLPTGNSKINVQFHGALSNGTLATNILIGILVDGGFVDGETSSAGLTSITQAVATDNTPANFSEMLTGLSAAAHNVCLTLAVSAGTGTIDSTNSVAKIQMYALP